MALSSNSKRGLALTALLPVLLSVYSEYRKDAETQAQRLSATIELKRKRHEADQERDLENAKNMLSSLTGDVADPNDAQHDGSFCNHLFVASELVRFTHSSRATRQVLNSALEYPDDAPAARAASQPLACRCGSELTLMRTSWAPSRRTAASLSVVAEMTETLGRVIELCEPEPAPPPPLASTATSHGYSAALPLPLPPAPAAAVVPPPPPPRSSTSASPSPVPREPVPAAIVRARPPVLASPQPLPIPEAAAAAEVPAGHGNALDAICTGAASGTALTGPPDGTPITVYIQIATEVQRPVAQRLQQALKSAGYDLPGIQRVGVPRSPRTPELRYFRVEDGAAVDGLVGDLRIVCPMAFADTTPPKLLANLRNQALPRTFEIWFPKPAAGAHP